MEEPKVTIADITDLVPDDRNFNKGTQYGKHLLEKSFDRFGAGRSVLIDKNNRLIAGNKSTEQYGESGGEKVIIVETDGKTLVAVKRTDVDLDTAYGREMALADNVVAKRDIDFDFEEIGRTLDEVRQKEWGVSISKEEFENAIRQTSEQIGSVSITTDGERNGEVGPDTSKEHSQPVYGAERRRTDDAYNLTLFDIESCTSELNIPKLEPEYIDAPESLIGFNYVRSSEDRNAGVHFFIDDYQFERVWNSPEENADILHGFRCAFTPDFSLYSNMPKAMMIWNTYRSRLLGQYWQRQNIHVIPTVSWAGEESFGFCFDGLPKCATLAVSTVGTKKAKDVFELGFSAMVETLRPKRILLYGTEMHNEFIGKFGIETYLYKSDFTNRTSYGHKIF